MRFFAQMYPRRFTNTYFGWRTDSCISWNLQGGDFSYIDQRGGFVPSHFSSEMQPAQARACSYRSDLPSCTYCGKTFVRRDNLKDHLRTHTGLRPFKCKLCPYAAKSKSNLNTHTRGKHLRREVDPDFSHMRLSNDSTEKPPNRLSPQPADSQPIFSSTESVFRRFSKQS